MRWSLSDKADLRNAAQLSAPKYIAGTALAETYPGDETGVLVVVGLLLALLSLALLQVWSGPSYLPLLGFTLAIIVIATAWGIRRAGHPRRHVALMRGILLGQSVLQTGLWLYILVGFPDAAGVATPASALGVILALAPLLYWLPGLFLVLVLHWLLFFPLLAASMRWWFGVGTALLLLTGWLFHRSLAQAAYQRRQCKYHLARVEEWESQCRDLGERLRYAEERLKSCQRELVEVRESADDGSRIKTEFLATISHEIRTPLNGILPILEMLQGTSLTAEQRRFVHAASNSSRHLLRIINDLLDFARAESGKLQLENIELNLEELAHSVLELMTGSAERKGLSLKLHIAPQTTLMVQGDPVRLRQVLANLLSNAIKFTEQGGVELTIEQIGSAGREVEIRFSILDTGIGLSPTEARGLFSSFTQADASTTRKFGGTGLGLAICRRLVELMGGRIGVRSALGQGSTFWFVLPLRRSLREIPIQRNSLEGIRVATSILDKALATRVLNNLRQWGMDATPVPPDDLLQQLREAALLGREAAFECLVLDAWGDRQALISALREIRAAPLLKAMTIVLISNSSEPTELTHNDFSVYVVSDAYRPGSLRRLFCRLFDVVGDISRDQEQDHLSGYLDLNLDQESVLLAEEALAETTDEELRYPLVLLVEDNPVNLGVVKRVLKRLGAGCLIAENGRRALDILDEGHAVDMVLMDCQMPVMDGYVATRFWREYEAIAGGHLPIIAMTANAMPGDNEKCRQAGMDDYLPKPVSIRSLARVLSRWTDAQTEVPALQAGPDEPGRREAQREGMLDNSTIAELREVMEDGFDEIITTFLEKSSELMDRLQEAEEVGDITAMAGPAHSLKSSSANMGAMKLSALARAIELAVRAGDPESALAAYHRMSTVFRATCTALRSELGRE